MSKQELSFIKQMLFCHGEQENDNEKEQFSLALTSLFNNHVLAFLKLADCGLHRVELDIWDNEMKDTIRTFLLKNAIKLSKENEQELFLKYLDYVE